MLCDCELFYPQTGVLVCSGCHNQTQQTGYGEQQKHILSRFWRPASMRSRCQQGWSLLRPPWLVDDCLLLVSFYFFNDVTSFFFFSIYLFGCVGSESQCVDLIAHGILAL